MSLLFLVRATKFAAISLNTKANSSSIRALVALFIRNYSIKRIIVKEGRRISDGGTPSGTATPVTQEASSGSPEKPQTIEEERRGSASDLEKGLNESEDGTKDGKDERDSKAEGGYVKKA